MAPLVSAFGGMHALRPVSQRTSVEMHAEPIVRIGTRGSPLALAQAYETKKRLG